MALFKNLFGKSDKKAPRGFQLIAISAIERLSADTVQVTFNVPNDGSFDFIPGQYINVAIEINGNEERRAYSICSGKSESLSIAIKEVENGKVSTWFNQEAKVGIEIFISKPEGSFTKPESAKNLVAIAAGSGITPIMSIAKQIEGDGTLRLYYGNKTETDILFKATIDGLSNTSPIYFLSREEKHTYENGRLTKESFTAEIKKDLSILQSDAFFICGPEEMINGVKEALAMFGVSEDKILFELFTTPTSEAGSKESKSEEYSGTCAVTVVVDGDEDTFNLSPDKSILDGAMDAGIDVPYSCRGGVCSSCKAKVTEGSATMRLNYSLTDKDVEEGFVLTCQAFPKEGKITVDYDKA